MAKKTNKKLIGRAVVFTVFAAGFGVMSAKTASASINSDAQKVTVAPVYQAANLFKKAGITYNQFNSVANGKKYFSRFGYRNGVGRPEGIVIHETATPNASAWAEARYFNSNWTKAYTYVHAVIDDQQAIQMSDTDYGVWGAGAQANNRFIQVELCRVNTRSQFVQSVANDASWIASMLRKYGLKPSRAQANGTGTIWSHHDVTNYLGGTDHVDPDTYFDQWGYSMSQFYSLINYYYNKQSSGTSSSSSKGSSAGTSSSSSSTSGKTSSSISVTTPSSGKTSASISVSTPSSGTSSASITVNTPSSGKTSASISVPSTSTGSSSASSSKTASRPVTQAPSYVVRTVMAYSRVYTSTGKKTNRHVNALKKVNCYGTRWINGKAYYQIGTNSYIRTLNVTGTKMTLKNKAYIYSKYGYRTGWHYVKGTRLTIYGGTYTIKKKKYRLVGYKSSAPIFVRSGNFY